MSKKKWIYAVTFGGARQDGSSSFDTGRFEVEKISPYVFPGGQFFGDDNSFNYDDANPMQLWDYIKNIGDKDVLAVKKITDLYTVSLLNAFHGDLELHEVLLYVAPASGIPPRLSAEERAGLATNKYMVKLWSESPSIVYCQAGVSVGNQKYDYVSFQLADVKHSFSN